MTYCLAIATQGGLVFCSDSRTNAGPDMLSSYSKMEIFRPAGDRVFVLLSAGNLATTQAVVSRMQQDMEEPDKTSLLTCGRLADAVRYVSEVSSHEAGQASATAASSGIDTSVSLIFGGQIGGSDPGIYLVYPAGNFITDSDHTPYLQIGESKFGKPILDRILTRTTSLEDAARCAIVSMDSTLRSNATVGPPIEVLVYAKDSFTTDHYVVLDEDDDYLRETKQAWNDALKDAFSRLPPFHWEERKGVNMQIVNDQFQPPGGDT